MSLPFAIFTFLIAWWITLFAVLPFGLKMREGGVAGRAALTRVALWNTLVAASVTLALHLILLSGWIPLRRVLP